MRRASPSPATPTAAPRGAVELVLDEEHLARVVAGGILAARRSLAIATADWKAMLVPEAGTRRARPILRVLADLARRGVEVRLLHAGVPSGPVLEALRDGIPRGLTIRRCPRLHSKIVVVDCRAMYMGSANLTGAGLGAKGAGKRNFEAGIWTESPALIDGALAQFDALWEGRPCATCRRRSICPVPLEEPRLAARDGALDAAPSRRISS
jgi:phosphatidylserine/phosphatidylglycerophosphate/cardiolipin synthase-like enzyme